MNNEELSIFQSREREIDEMISSTLGYCFESYMPPVNGAYFQKFRNHLIYVINSFIKDEESNELFIKIPIQEFANLEDGSAERQIRRFKEIANSIYKYLSLCTLSNSSHLISYPHAYRNIENGDTEWYHEGDLFYLEDPCNQFCDFVKARYNHTGQLSLSFYSYNNTPLNLSNDKKEEIIGRSVIYRLGISELPNQIRSSLVNCRSEIKTYTKSLEALREYLSPIEAPVVFCNFNLYQPVTARFIDDGVQVCTSNELFENMKNGNHGSYGSSLMVFYGDRTYLNNAQLVRNQVSLGQLHKVIYIGSSAPFDDIMTYEFSFREMNAYCSYAKGRFHEITFRGFDFPWLSDIMKDLKNLMDNCRLDDSISAQLISLFLYEFTSSYFSGNRLEFLKENENFREHLSDILFEADDASYDLIISWFNNLTLQEDSPKKQYMDSQNNSYNIHRWESFVRDLRRMSGVNNRICIDSSFMACAKIPMILENHLFPQIEVLYYQDCERDIKNHLENFLNREKLIYTSDVRTRYGTEIRFEDARLPVQQVYDLADYIGDYEMDIGQDTSERTVYQVRFEDGVTLDLIGDVLALNNNAFERVPLSELHNYLGREIKCYHSPDNFNSLMANYVNLPDGDTIESWSFFWKDRFREYVRSQVSEGRNENQVFAEINRDVNIPIERLSIYYGQGQQGLFMNVRDMSRLMRYLNLHDVVTDQEMNYVLAARRFNSTENISFGRRLKSLIFNYIIEGSVVSNELQELLERCRCSIDDLVHSSVYSGIISEIINGN